MMGIVVAYRVKELKYSTFGEGGMQMPQDTLRIEFENGETAFVPNAGWSTDNPALCVMAYLGARPSDLEAAEGKLLPIKLDQKGNVYAHKQAVAEGKGVLERADWFAPEVSDEMDIEVGP